MKAWTKEEALQTLQELADESDRLKGSKVFSTEQTMWEMRCLETFEEVFGKASRYYLSFAAINWGTVDRHIETWQFEDFKSAIDANRHEYFLGHLEAAKGFLLGAINYLKARELPEVYSAKDTGPEASLILKVLHLAEHKLRKVVRDRPDKERQIQDAFETLLIGVDIPYEREADKIVYSSKTGMHPVRTGLRNKI